MIALSGVTKVYPNGVKAVDGVDLAVGSGEFVALVGPSGSGKSTLLRLVAGLEEPTAGRVEVGGRDVAGVAPRGRDVAMVFQEPALYPYLSVFENLAFGLRARRVKGAEVRARVRAVAEPLGLSGVLDRRPGTLSGGQRRRVALGRAVARRPAAFLLDEPLTGLDAPLRTAVRGDLLDLHRQTGAATLYVTHDQAEALATGDRVAVMHAGRVEQVGPPRAVYERPATVFVAGFIGSPPMNLIPLRVSGALGPEDWEWGAPEALRHAAPRDPWAAGDVLGLRPEHVRLARDGEGRDESLYWHPPACEVARVEYLGNETVATVLLGVHPVRARLAPADETRPGDRRWVGLDLSRASWFDRTTGRSLRP